MPGTFWSGVRRTRVDGVTSRACPLPGLAMLAGPIHTGRRCRRRARSLVTCGRLPRGQLPGGQLPGGQLPGGQLPGGRLPGGQLPGGGEPAERSHDLALAPMALGVRACAVKFACSLTVPGMFCGSRSHQRSSRVTITTPASEAPSSSSTAAWIAGSSSLAPRRLWSVRVAFGAPDRSERARIAADEAEPQASGDVLAVEPAGEGGGVVGVDEGTGALRGGRHRRARRRDRRRATDMPATPWSPIRRRTAGSTVPRSSPIKLASCRKASRTRQCQQLVGGIAHIRAVRRRPPRRGSTTSAGIRDVVDPESAGMLAAGGRARSERPDSRLCARPRGREDGSPSLGRRRRTIRGSAPSPMSRSPPAPPANDDGKAQGS